MVGRGSSTSTSTKTVHHLKFKTGSDYMFDTFATMRRIRDDRELTSTQKLVLLTMLSRADGQTGRVHASQQMIAEDAGVNIRTVERALKAIRETWFEADEVGLQVNFTFHNYPAQSRVLPGTESGPLLTSTTITSAPSSSDEEELAGGPPLVPSVASQPPSLAHHARASWDDDEATWFAEMAEKLKDLEAS